jgi:hypothetical protein
VLAFEARRLPERFDEMAPQLDAAAGTSRPEAA